MKRQWVGLLVGSVIAVCVSCETNPYTERPQLLLLPLSSEIHLGEQAYQQVLKDPKTRISHDPKETEPVKRVAARIIEGTKQSKYAATANRFACDVNFIKDSQAGKAFRLPG